MKLLILTQTIDKGDTILGFFHDWICEFYKQCGAVVAVGLRVGEHSLPSGVKVVSLGKERGHGRLRVAWGFFKVIYMTRNSYDTVFVHMNQEYVLLGFLFWKLMGKRIILWRNHPMGTILTRLAVIMSDKVLCTSPQSFTNRFAKTSLMPVGINTQVFSRSDSRNTRSLVYVGRISTIKKIEILLDAVELLTEWQVSFCLSIYGDSIDTPLEQKYFKSICNRIGLLKESIDVRMFEGVSYENVAKIYNENQILINLTPRGSFDKVIFEMMSTGGVVVVSNRDVASFIPQDFRNTLIFKEGDAKDLAMKLRDVLNYSDQCKNELGMTLRDIVVEHHSLSRLVTQIISITT